MKKLSLNLDSAQSSVVSLQDPLPSLLHTPIKPERPRRPSIASLPTINATSSLLHRKEEEGDQQTVPYTDGPVQVIPGIWIGSEDNARDWKGLIERGIRSVLNVAKEVVTPFDSPQSHPLRTALSTPDFRSTNHPDPTYCPPHVPSGRPAMHYLKLQWSHGQQDLVNSGFKDGMQFADAALKRGEGCLIHCQCGISRSATMVIAIVMRAAAERQTSVPPEIWDLKGMQGAYSYVKDKSPCVGPNMSLIYQLLEYEKKLRGDKGSLNESDGASSGTDEEEEWGRRRQLLDEDGEEEHESSIVMQEAKALDKAMEDRIVARKSSASSMSSGFAIAPTWKSRYISRKRTGSIASSKTTGSLLSDEVVEEEEEEDETSSIGATSFDSESRRSRYNDSASTTPDDETGKTPRGVSLLTPGPATARPPPSAPVWKQSFSFPPPPATAIRSSFDIPPLPPKPKGKRKPLGLTLLPPVPSSPITLIVEPEEPEQPPVTAVQPQPPASISRSGSSSSLSLPPVRQRTESRRLVPPPLHLRNSVLRKASAASSEAESVAPTPSQTLFVFPPSPTMNARTPSTMTLMSSTTGSIPFPSLSTPRVSTFRSKGRTRSFIGLGAPPTPTVAFSKVDVRGIVGLE
ncbi:hypothetical protein CVT24_005763 [Panaeolus cyanescens]|uniref:protein-tyrosine-phosphatase n=1 Tax=Panaeolus cyanescens TaxID=181874 RepID=A0A409YF20_9AGAR|nr:hypothetical protein CVT24_005763 [Panaeolus cyanescens]